MIIQKANITDNEILTAITKKSKAYWGYSAEQIQKWDKNLTISQDYIRDQNVFKLVDNDFIVGYYSYVFKNEKVIELDNLFILPEYIGKGFGKHLVLDFLNRIKEEKTERIILDSEPNAEEFYSKMGFVKIGEFETSIKNRFMPIMEMKL
ncbi:GNAT family N-acetyltransferase [Flavobacterium nitrogenifigens]|uniref:Acetyltransferase (GNAT) domain-containing protein n=1 Tax=Flavobacterium nitrogenifigens TaxID=1617283 RepID=A0A521D2F0_9FLAO|nr:GNAT family N-acetyltransferase [Flavobacterium nitrogenifigens]KAF2332696.1 GNAT family N-acetyltransferase [Flavobacterium nitrogenifigens]SMO65864.1 Acetyltransferase (GNAT) domain-containing protein [Flavobacterium nitrogenifigens]